MDWIHKLMNIVLPPLTLILLCFLLPPYLLFQFLDCIKRSIFKENVAGKVVLITGASSGIGECLAYEYAKRGACLALVARRESRLQAVAAKARQLGSPDVIVVCSDVSKVEDCKRFIDETLNHFGRLDHLVNNAGILQISKFEETQISDSHPLMSTNFWGTVYGTHFAIPFLRKSKGKIIVIASVAGWLPTPSVGFYCASKAALISLYDTLRIEFGSDIGITIVTPGVVESEITQSPEYSSEAGFEFVPVLSTEVCAKAIVDGTCRGDRYVTQPSWVRVLFVFKALCPEVLDWCARFLFITRPSKKKTA